VTVPWSVDGVVAAREWLASEADVISVH